MEGRFGIRDSSLQWGKLINYSCATSCIISLHPKKKSWVAEGGRGKEIFVGGYWEGYSPRKKLTWSLISYLVMRIFFFRLLLFSEMRNLPCKFAPLFWTKSFVAKVVDIEHNWVRIVIEVLNTETNCLSWNLSCTPWNYFTANLQDTFSRDIVWSGWPKSVHFNLQHQRHGMMFFQHSLTFSYVLEYFLNLNRAL